MTAATLERAPETVVAALGSNSARGLARSAAKERFEQHGPNELKGAPETPWWERAAVFLRAADLLSGPWRDTINAATMLGQSKNCYQAEIDAACESIDFLKFAAHYYMAVYGLLPHPRYPVIDQNKDNITVNT